MNMGRFSQTLDNTEQQAEHSVPETPVRAGNHYDTGMAGAGPVALDKVAQGITDNHSPAGFTDAINAAHSAVGNRNFMQFVDAVRQHASPPDAHSIAAQGLMGPDRPLTHLDTIQSAFGHHNVGAMREHTGREARMSLDALGAAGFSTRGRMAFSGTPDLYSQAHEAAHGVQQAALGSRIGLKGGIGEEGDRYEQQADDVAQAVIEGKSAESLLDRVAGGPTKVSPGRSGGDGAV